MIGGQFIGWVLDQIPKVVNFLKRKGRENEVDKIENAVDSGDVKSVNNELSSIVKDSESRRKQNS